MTLEQAKTYLLLGVKLKGERWQGYIYQEGGTVYKHNSITNKPYKIDLVWYMKPNKEADKYGEWVVMNE